MTAKTSAPIQTPDADLVHLVETAQRALAEGDLEAAREAYTTMAEQFADEPVAHNNLGAFEMGVGNAAAAEASFARAAALAPDRANCLFNLALTQYQQGKFADAVVNFERAHELDPTDAEALNNLGACRYQLGALHQARQDVEAALKLQPNYPNAIMNLSDMEFMAGNVDRAIAICQAYLDHHHDLGVTRQLLTILDAAREQARATVDVAAATHETATEAVGTDLAATATD